MADLRTLQTNLNSGELDARVGSRTDVTHYFNGLEYARNVLLLPQGGARRRPGSEYLAEQSKILSEIDLTAGGVTVTAPAGGTAANAIDGDEATEVISGAAGTTSPFVLVHVDLGAEFDVSYVDIRALRLTTGGTTCDEEVALQYSTDNVTFVDFGTLGNPVLSVSSASIQRRFSSSAPVTARYWRLSRNGATNLTTDTFRFGEIKMWRQTDTLSDARLIGFKFSTTQSYMLVATDRNLMVFKDGVVQANCSIPHTSAQLAGLNWVQSLDNLYIFHEDVQPHNIERQGADDEWDDEAQAFSNIYQFNFGSGAEDTWSDTRGWPRCGTFHEGRLWLGGTAQRPTTFWGSKVNSLFDFDAGGGNDDEAIEATLDFDDVASIFNLHSGRHLQIFTQTAEFYVLPDSDPITPSNITRKATSRIGSSRPGIRVQALEGAVLFIERRGRGVREFLFTDIEQAYSATPLTLLASHLLDSPGCTAVRRSSSDAEGDLFFMCNDDGSLPVLQTMRSQDISGWALWHTDGLYKDVGVDNEKDVYTSVERVINGATVRFVERFQDTFYMDAGLMFTTGLPTSTFSVPHLEAETVSVRSDDNVFLNRVVASGSITTEDDTLIKAEVGLPFADCKEAEVTRLVDNRGFTQKEARRIVFNGNSDGVGEGDQVWIRDMPLGVAVNTGEGAGTAFGEMKGVVEVTLRVHETQGFHLGANGEPLGDVANFRSFGDDLLDERSPFFTGELRVESLMGADTFGQVEVTQRDPVAMTVLSITKKVDLS